MGFFKPIRSGSWWIHSESDERWRRSGTSDGVGGFVLPPEAEQAIEELKSELGEEPPDDLEYGYMKD